MELAGSMVAAFQLAAGAMVFALAIAVLIGRWVTADEDWVGVLLRGLLLLIFAVLMLQRFGSPWYWLTMPLAAV